MWTNLDMIKFFYKRNSLNPSLEWYKNKRFINEQQYNDIKNESKT